MKSHTSLILRRAFGGIALILTMAGATRLTHAQDYIVTDLGVLSGRTDSTPTALNDNGQVAGIATSGKQNTEVAFRYHPDSRRLEPLTGSLPGSLTRAFDINNEGAVVGDSTFGSNLAQKVPVRRAALFQKGSVADLGTLKAAGPYSRANAINASSQVVGSAGPTLDDHTTRAFAWTAATGMRDIGTLGGAYAQALAINDAGYVTGDSTLANSRTDVRHAFLYQLNSRTGAAFFPMRDLGTLGGDFSVGTAINSAGHVAGYSTVDEEGRYHAFLHDGTTMQDLGSLAGDGLKADQSFALGINNFDHVVGYAFLPLDRGAMQVAFISRKGVMEDLNQLIGKAAQRYLLYAATGINEKGQIIATAFDYNSNVFRAVLLTPAGLANSRR